jgi:hypothetical protein
VPLSLQEFRVPGSKARIESYILVKSIARIEQGKRNSRLWQSLRNVASHNGVISLLLTNGGFEDLLPHDPSQHDHWLESLSVLVMLGEVKGVQRLRVRIQCFDDIPPSSS